MSSHSRAEEREMMLSPLKWPHLWLPLKRRGRGTVETAVLGTATNDDSQEIEVYIGANVFRIQETGGEVKKYKDVDAVLDDGWVVD